MAVNLLSDIFILTLICRQRRCSVMPIAHHNCIKHSGGHPIVWQIPENHFPLGFGPGSNPDNIMPETNVFLDVELRCVQIEERHHIGGWNVRCLRGGNRKIGKTYKFFWQIGARKQVKLETRLYIHYSYR